MSSDLIIHYYLNDPNLHQINAKLANKNQAIIIDIIEDFAIQLGIAIELDVVASKEGGFKDILRLKPKTTTDRWISGLTLLVLIPFLLQITGKFLTQDSELDTLQKEYYKAKLEQIKQEDSLNEEQIKEIDQLMCCADRLDIGKTDIKIKEKRSTVYKQLNDDKNVSSIAIETNNAGEEIKTIGSVEKKDFCTFIINTPQRKIEVDENATIEIISPVLNNSKYRWRGNYNNQVIEFSVKDKEFKNKILNENLQFGSNNILSAVLEIRKDIDEDGNEKISSYAVLEVLGTELKDGYIEMPRAKKIKKSENQMDLFSSSEEVEKNK